MNEQKENALTVNVYVSIITKLGHCGQQMMGHKVCKGHMMSKVVKTAKNVKAYFSQAMCLILIKLNHTDRQIMCTNTCTFKVKSHLGSKEVREPLSQKGYSQGLHLILTKQQMIGHKICN